MGNKRQYGKPEYLMFAVASASVISAGDMLWYDSTAKTAKAATDFTWDTNIATTQTAFKLQFIGISMDDSASGDTDPIRVSGDCVGLFDAASAEFEPIDLVGPAKATGDALENQKVAITTTAATSIGRSLENVVTTTTPLCHIVAEAALAYSKAPHA